MVIEGLNIIPYKGLNILFLSKKINKNSFYYNNNDIFLDATFKVCNNLFSQFAYYKSI